MFSRLVRRTHMYLALFLTPWLLGYALSTIVMNHRVGGPRVLVKEAEQAYLVAFEPGTSPSQIGRQILEDLHLDGAFGVEGPHPDGTIVVNRQDLMAPRRITYSPAESRLTIERVPLEASQWLNRFHRRRGYQQPYAADRAMAWSVDLVIAALVVWAASGLWMWWEMRATHVWGMVAALAGIGIFAFFAATV